MPSAAQVDRLSAAHERLIDGLDEAHGANLATVLEELERQIEKAVGNKEITPSEAIKKRIVIEAAIRGTFLNWAHETVDEYELPARNVVSMLQKLGAIEGWTPQDAVTVNQLKRVAFSGYEDIAERYLNILSNGLYMNSLTGRPMSETQRELRQAINGVFARSDSAEAQRLVDFINEHRADPDFDEEVAKATERLHTEFARDVAGNNLRRYAYQQTHDAIRQFNGSFVAAQAEAAGLSHFKYNGDIISTSRSFCKGLIGSVLSKEEIMQKWSEKSWAGKAPGSPFEVRGGYNCRHHFTPVKPEWVN